MKMSQTARRKLGNTFIAVGLVLVLVGVGYEIAIYPWRIVLQKVGIQVSDTLPEPKPLPQMNAPLQNGGTGVEELPEGAGMFSTRPLVGLTKLGVIQIPKIGISENLVEGVGNEMLYAVGHMPGTPMPGEGGNSVFAAHRDYVRMNPFRHLDKIGEGDLVRVRIDDTVYIYEVYKNFVVNPWDFWVTEPQEGETEMITLLTCTPVLTSTHRMVVWGRLTETRPAA